MADGHDTIELAALAGMDTCKRTMPREVECGFGIYQKDGKFYPTKVGTGTRGSIENMPISFPKTATLVGFGHTHPKGEHLADADDTTDALSPQDVAFAKKAALLMFLGSEKSGNVVRYKHGDKTSSHSNLGRIAYGTPIGPYGLDDPEARKAQLSSAYDLHTKTTAP